jgi:hypothetical protein
MALHALRWRPHAIGHDCIVADDVSNDVVDEDDNLVR